MKNLYNNIALVILSLSFSGSLQAKSSQKSSSIDVFAAEIGGSGDNACQKYDKQCLMFVGDGPLASDLDFTYSIKRGKSSSIELTLDQKVVDQINSRLGQYKDKKIAFMYKGEIFWAPVVKEKIKGNKVSLTFFNEQDFNRVLKVLSDSKS